ncbi:proline-rich protein 2-like [Hippopotamus amphibius kiboko]|uniref:proline-rich protein 2-like n=1 Tax=Hippopotamus amphibius kiboko TaxID=575201 RepID=UPI002593C3FF|nr:proline-rich protein 2-like [Hippopotamus amphibius kiboko]
MGVAQGLEAATNLASITSDSCPPASQTPSESSPTVGCEPADLQRERRHCQQEALQPTKNSRGPGRQAERGARPRPPGATRTPPPGCCRAGGRRGNRRRPHADALPRGGSTDPAGGRVPGSRTAARAPSARPARRGRPSRAHLPPPPPQLRSRSGRRRRRPSGRAAAGGLGLRGRGRRSGRRRPPLAARPSPELRDPGPRPGGRAAPAPAPGPRPPSGRRVPPGCSGFTRSAENARASRRRRRLPARLWERAARPPRHGSEDAEPPETHFLPRCPTRVRTRRVQPHPQRETLSSKIFQLSRLQSPIPPPPGVRRGEPPRHPRESAVIDLLLWHREHQNPPQKIWGGGGRGVISQLRFLSVSGKPCLVRHLLGLPQPLGVQTVAFGPLGWSPGEVTAASREFTGADFGAVSRLPPAAPPPQPPGKSGDPPVCPKASRTASASALRQCVLLQEVSPGE